VTGSGCRVADTEGSLRLSWFDDGRFLGTVLPEQPLWWRPSAGRHSFVVFDECGRPARRTLRVTRSR